MSRASLQSWSSCECQRCLADPGDGASIIYSPIYCELVLFRKLVLELFLDESQSSFSGIGPIWFCSALTNLHGFIFRLRLNFLFFFSSSLGVCLIRGLNQTRSIVTGCCSLCFSGLVFILASVLSRGWAQTCVSSESLVEGFIFSGSDLGCHGSRFGAGESRTPTREDSAAPDDWLVQVDLLQPPVYQFPLWVIVWPQTTRTSSLLWK